MEWYIRLVETGLVPDLLIRYGIRRLLANHLKTYRRMDIEEWTGRFSRIRERFSSGPIAVAVDKANEQHYELPPAGVSTGGCFLWPVRRLLVSMVATSISYHIIVLRNRKPVHDRALNKILGRHGDLLQEVSSENEI
jgi:hypothetical protein